MVTVVAVVVEKEEEEEEEEAVAEVAEVVEVVEAAVVALVNEGVGGSEVRAVCRGPGRSTRCRRRGPPSLRPATVEEAAGGGGGGAVRLQVRPEIRVVLH